MSIATFVITHYVDNARMNQAQNDRLHVLEETMKEVRAVQAVNVEARIKQEQILDSNAAILAAIEKQVSDTERMMGAHERSTSRMLKGKKQ